MPARYKVTKRSGTDNWQLRYYVPVAYQSEFGKREVLKSLQTTVKSIADERALDVVKELNSTVKAAVKAVATPDRQEFAEPVDVVSEPSHALIDTAAREVYEAEVEADWEERSDPEHMNLMGLGGKKSSKAYRKLAKKMRTAAASGDYSFADFEYWSDHFGFEFVKNSVKENRFRKLLAYASIEAAERWAEHDLGVRGTRPSLPELRRPKATLSAPPDIAKPEADTSAKTNSLDVDQSSLLELWASHERQRGEGVKSATLSDRQVSLRWFADFVGIAKPAASITKADAVKWRDLLYQFPSKTAQRKEFADQSFKDIIKLNERFGHSVISQRTVAKHISGLFTFYQWLLDEGRVSENVFTGLAPIINRKGKQAAEFSDEQLGQLFGSPLFTGCASTKDIRGYSSQGETQVRDWRFWLPLMSAFSGARLGELAQLHTTDIRMKDGVYYFDINDQGPGDKTTKSEWSNRMVPVHSELQNIGFLTFVDAAKSKGNERLFPELERSERGYFDNASKWFAKYFARMQFTPNSRGHLPKFHSFRHSAITRMSQELSDHEIRPIVGHEETTTTKGYRETPTYSIIKRQQFIELIRYAGLDLSHLYGCHHVALGRARRDAG
ncbi:tyrosine-type recombinase/integrase [Sulfitobacter pontiacus]|uniref:tyrosine-type recombinase/integrase n=1 Tax=Sulfitobacter pontiacus TaxID=60137 RepID=UPI0030EBD13E